MLAQKTEYDDDSTYVSYVSQVSLLSKQILQTGENAVTLQ